MEQTPVSLLGQAFDFSAEDIRHNRQGQLSPHQRQTLRRHLRETLGIIGLLLGAPLLVAGVVVWFTGTGDGNLGLITATGLVIGLVLAGFFISANYRRLALALDLRRGAVQAISGKVQRQGRYLVVQRQRFLVEDAALDLIQSGLGYTFYYLPRARHILSVEFAE